MPLIWHSGLKIITFRSFELKTILFKLIDHIFQGFIKCLSKDENFIKIDTLLSAASHEQQNEPLKGSR